MDAYSEQVLTWMVTYGAPMLAFTLFLGALGSPLPETFFVIAGGAFIRQGVLDVFDTLVLSLISLVIGDYLGFLAGRGAYGYIERRWSDAPAWERATHYFEEKGDMSIFLTRWLVTPISMPVNVLAGASGYSSGRFLFYATTGELLWLVLYGGLGYWFGSQWEVVSQFVTDFSGVVMGIVLLVGGLFTAVRRQVKKRRRPATGRLDQS
jgi:membrane-associated protein